MSHNIITKKMETLELIKSYKNHIDDSFKKACENKSKISEEILKMEGMSGVKTRHFYNNILNFPNVRYLEIGTWKGSSLCSAMYNNKAEIICIDNWSLFNGPKDEFLINLEKYKGENTVNFIENDCFKVDTTTLGKFNIYMYDGHHSYLSHYHALDYYIKNMDDIFIYIVDDWNYERVQKGTRQSIKDLGLITLYEKIVLMTRDGSHTPMDVAKTSWWNGIGIFLLQKPKYTKKWFSSENFGVLNEYKNKNNVNFLEIGSFEGLSSNYFLNNCLNGNECTMTCIDPWIKYSESTVANIEGYDDIINEETYDRFVYNTLKFNEKIVIKRGFSNEILPTLEENKYDFVYIDGDHSRDAVWLDATQSFGLLKDGGYMVFDDYLWKEGDKSPKDAIDRFLNEYKEKIQIIKKNHQVVIRKGKHQINNQKQNIKKKNMNKNKNKKNNLKKIKNKLMKRK